jgi:hypothetical protein
VFLKPACVLEQWQQPSRQLHADLYPILRKLEREGLKYFARKGESFRFSFCPNSGQLLGKHYTLASHVSGGADTIKVSRTSLAKIRIKT